MKPLRMNQWVLTWLCLYPPEKTASGWKQLAYVIIGLIVLGTNLCGLGASGTYFLRYLPIDLTQSLFALFHIVCFISAIYAAISMFFLRQKMPGIFENLSRIFDTNIKEKSFKYLVEANNKCDWIWHFYFKYIMGGFLVSTGSMCVLSVILCWIMNRNFDTKLLYHPNKFIVPWNQQTLAGYIAEASFIIFGCETYLGGVGAPLLLFISFCLFHDAFYKMFRHFINELDHSDAERNNRELLRKIVQFHNSAKEWFLQSAEVYSIILLIQLILNMIFLAVAIFQLDLQLKNIGFDVSILLTAFSVSLSILFSYCLFGKLATESFEKMADCLYEANWQDLPVSLQKYFILMILNSQRTLYYDGFGIMITNLETFCKLLRNVATFYMMFKTLTTK